MKRRIFAMGALKPARIVPEHNTFEPTIRLPALKSLIAYCDKFHNIILATEIINVIISDINSDIQVEEVSNTSIYEYYMDYYDILSKCIAANDNKLSELYELLQTLSISNQT